MTGTLTEAMDAEDWHEDGDEQKDQQLRLEEHQKNMRSARRRRGSVVGRLQGAPTLGRASFAAGGRRSGLGGRGLSAAASSAASGQAAAPAPQHRGVSAPRLLLFGLPSGGSRAAAAAANEQRASAVSPTPFRRSVPHAVRAPGDDKAEGGGGGAAATPAAPSAAPQSKRPSLDLRAEPRAGGERRYARSHTELGPAAAARSALLRAGSTKAAPAPPRDSAAVPGAPHSHSGAPASAEARQAAPALDSTSSSKPSGSSSGSSAASPEEIRLSDADAGAEAKGASASAPPPDMPTGYVVRSRRRRVSIAETPSSAAAPDGGLPPAGAASARLSRRSHLASASAPHAIEGGGASHQPQQPRPSAAAVARPAKPSGPLACFRREPPRASWVAAGAAGRKGLFAGDAEIQRAYEDGVKNAKQLRRMAWVRGPAARRAEGSGSASPRPSDVIARPPLRGADGCGVCVHHVGPPRVVHLRLCAPAPGPPSLASLRAAATPVS